MKFKPITSYTMEELFFSKSTFAIKTKSGTMYDECELLSNAGYAGLREFFFRTSAISINGSDVELIAFEEPEKDPQNNSTEKVLNVYAFRGRTSAGTTGEAIVLANDVDEAVEKIINARYDFYDDADRNYIKRNITEYSLYEFEMNGYHIYNDD